MVQVVAIFTSIAFGGVIIVVLGLVFFGGGSASAEDQLLSDAKTRVQQEPKNPDAWEQLASAYRAKNELPQAIAAAQKALSFAPNDFSRLQTVISLQLDQGDSAGAIAALSEYTRATRGTPTPSCSWASRRRRRGGPSWRGCRTRPSCAWRPTTRTPPP